VVGKKQKGQLCVLLLTTNHSPLTTASPIEGAAPGSAFPYVILDAEFLQHIAGPPGQTDAALP
jgi:hypothetical protein